MNNQFITDTILNQQGTMENGRLSNADFKVIKEREHHIAVSISDRERQLEMVIAMQDWYKKNEKATHQLEDATNHHNQVNKQYLALRGEEMKLNRFDSVQDFRPYYEQLCERRKIIETIKLQEAEVAQDIELARNAVEEAGRKSLVMKERLQDTKEQYQLQKKIIDEGLMVNGEINMLAEELIQAEDNLSEANHILGQNEANLRSRQQEVEQTKLLVENLNLHKQALDVHQQLFEQFQAVNDKLQLFYAESKSNEKIHEQFTRNNRRLSELTILLEKQGKLLQTKRERLDALKAEMTIHETALEETDNALLYNHYARHQLRLVQLQSARNVWQTIIAGYSAIETQRATLERLIRHYEQKQQEQQIAEREVKRLFERYTRLNKACILLQIENTRKLREGLKEGIACPVCGSAHHPYHTEVEQVLGETQTQLEKDFLETKREYELKQEQALEVAAEVQKQAGNLNAEKNMLTHMMEQQKLLVEDWNRFSKLDSSFTTCSPSVNREARRTTIDMLIDSEDKHTKEYEQRIRKYDLHASKVKEINTEVLAGEEEVERLKTQFWQIETEHKLVSERVESIRTQMGESDNRLEHLYKGLDDVVTLSGWRDDNLESFSKNLSELYADWKETNKNQVARQHDLEILQLKAEIAKTARDKALQKVGSAREERDRLRELLNGKREKLRKYFGNTSPSDLAAHHQHTIEEAEGQLAEAGKNLVEAEKKFTVFTGKKKTLEEYRQQQEEQVHDIQTTLDHAIARYNLTHTAIQSSELNIIFTDSRDWQLLRVTIQECRDALIISGENMKFAENNFMKLQGDANRPSKDRDEDQPSSLARRQADLILELDKLRGEQADIRRILQRHEASI